MSDYPRPLPQLATDLRLEQLDLTEYVHILCDRIDSVEPGIRALVPEDGRRERIEHEAKKIQKQYPEPHTRPPLFGVPVAVKDIFHVDGFKTRANSDVPAGSLAGPEADVVTQLRDAGVIIIGKAVTTEFACFKPGPTRNPHNPEHTPGGSSSGSGAAVGAGIAPLALGSQTAGSTLRPASFCGVVGYKPSHGRMSTAGMLPLAASADHVGVITQDVAGVNLAAAVLCEDWEPETSRHDKPVLGVPEGSYLEQASREAQTAFRDHIQNLKNTGFQVQQVQMFEDIETINESHYRLLTGEIALSDHHEWFEAHGESYSPKMTELVQDGRNISVAQLAYAREEGLALRNEIRTRMHQEEIDVLVSPTTTGPAPEGLESTGSYKMNLPWTYAGVPAVTIPAGEAENGLPLGLQCASQYWTDEQLITWCGQIEEDLPGVAPFNPEDLS